MGNKMVNATILYLRYTLSVSIVAWETPQCDVSTSPFHSFPNTHDLQSALSYYYVLEVEYDGIYMMRVLQNLIFANTFQKIVIEYQYVTK